MKKQLCLLAVLGLGLSLAHAEQWEVPVGKPPSNKPVKNTTKANEKLDFIAFSKGKGDDASIGIRVRNGKHKMGPTTITVDFGNAEMVVQRVDITTPVAKMVAKGDGEHLLSSFKSGDKPYDVFCVVKGGQIESKLIVRTGK